MWASLPELLDGLLLTLELVALALFLGFFVAVGVALLRLSSYRPLSAFAYAYVFVFRGTPLLVQIFLIYYGLGQFEAIRESFLWTFFREPFWCAILALTLNTGAYTSEIIRGGIQSVPFGQIEAARACGMGSFLLFRRIVFPIAIRQALPAYGNEVILMVKATSLASTITLMEVTGIARSTDDGPAPCDDLFRVGPKRTGPPSTPFASAVVRFPDGATAGNCCSLVAAK